MKTKRIFLTVCIIIGGIISTFAEDIPNNEIWYTSSDGEVVTPYKTDVFGANIVSNTYTSGKGIIKFDGNITSIGDRAFSSCASLTSITIPNSVASIGEDAFYRCTGLTSITIPNSVTSIGDRAFSSCTGLTSITILNTVTDFGEGVIWGCDNLTSIVCPSQCLDEKSLTYQQEYYPTHLQRVVINAGELTENALSVINLSYRTLNVIDVSAATNTTLTDEAFKGCYNLDTLRLPNQLTHVPYMAVADSKNLKTIDIPASVEEIDQSAFENCRSLHTITFGGEQPQYIASRSALSATSALRKIGNWAFYNAHELRNLTIPEGVEEIGDAAFYGCTYLDSLSLPSTVNRIGDNCFALCSKLKAIYVDATTPPVIQAKTFFDVSRQIPVFVPDEAVDTYKADNLWGELNIQGRNTPESIENTSTAKTGDVVNKYIHNGHLYILRDGKIYTAQGAMVDER